MRILHCGLNARHKLHDVYRLGADRVLTKRRASSTVRDEALAAMMHELDDLEADDASHHLPSDAPPPA